MRRVVEILGSAGLIIVMVSFFAGCQQPQPAQCVCNCEGPPPEGAIIKIKEDVAEQEAASAPKKTVQKEAPAAVPGGPSVRERGVIGKRTTPPVRVPRKARGRIAAAPGSGVPVDMSGADKDAMKAAFLKFAEGAKARNLGEMKKATTERLGNSLESSLEKYSERLYRRTDLFSAGAATGVTIGRTNDLGNGNFDIEIKFGTGEPVSVLFFKEEGNWRLNRL